MYLQALNYYRSDRGDFQVSIQTCKHNTDHHVVGNLHNSLSTIYSLSSFQPLYHVAHTATNPLTSVPKQLRKKTPCSSCSKHHHGGQLRSPVEIHPDLSKTSTQPYNWVNAGTIVSGLSTPPPPQLPVYGYQPQLGQTWCATIYGVWDPCFNYYDNI